MKPVLKKLAVVTVEPSSNILDLKSTLETHCYVDAICSFRHLSEATCTYRIISKDMQETSQVLHTNESITVPKDAAEISVVGRPTTLLVEYILGDYCDD